MRMKVFQGSGASGVDLAEQVFSDWRRIPTREVPNANTNKLQLAFEVQTNRTDGQSARPGDTLLIDDVDVWESSTHCAENR